MRGQEHIANNIGLLYEVEPNGTTIRSVVENTKFGLFKIRKTGLS